MPQSRPRLDPSPSVDPLGVKKLTKVRDYKRTFPSPLPPRASTPKVHKGLDKPLFSEADLTMPSPSQSRSISPLLRSTPTPQSTPAQTTTFQTPQSRRGSGSVDSMASMALPQARSRSGSVASTDSISNI